jgi:hypothetical protein
MRFSSARDMLRTRDEQASVQARQHTGRSG